jgi:hypothetical protein
MNCLQLWLEVKKENKKALAKFKVWLKPFNNLKQKHPAKAGGNSYLS